MKLPQIKALNRSVANGATNILIIQKGRAKVVCTAMNDYRKRKIRNNNRTNILVVEQATRNNWRKKLEMQRKMMLLLVVVMGLGQEMLVPVPVDLLWIMIGDNAVNFSNVYDKK